ncbi:hypothetical protein B0T11DRAFT_74893 [Plectosphaerella cucumerina]|uniref:Uncharacterized protein n=1 Tax=Plectosphaerella cucumerina TaxID=40658 RepID=A0A8K0TJC5_9PEZI|nr:hypothetical protein B0T11DRAFT_74893 [Plectosphaerella cucumerina]
MDHIVKALRGLNLGKSSKPHSPEKPPRRNSEAHTDRDKSKEADELLRLLATNLISYALRKYLSSSHNKKRIAAGGVEIDHVILQAIGEKVLEKVLQAVCAAAEAPERQHDRSNSAERRRRRRRENEEQYRRGRRRSPRSESADRRRRERRHRRDHGSPRRESHAADNPVITITPPDEHETAAPEAPASSSSQRSSRRRVTRADRAEMIVPLDGLRGDLEALSERLIDLSARAALPEGKAGHGDCDFYEKFVEKSGPVQDVIGEVLGKIREVEEADVKGKRR